ncbi:MAG TPA: 5-formyltetrahydrofolate cyclo-ligase [Paracoccaceae bacterium]|nr:5-formyltetrahydrofolate cyclo-ligase [Paracoccaceae bacterium]
MSDEKNRPGYSSPPCYAHEFELGEHGYAEIDPETARDVARWRKSERERLIAMRLQVPIEERKQVGDEIAAELDRLIDMREGLIVSTYWPFRGELDLRDWMISAVERGVRIGLPVVVAKGQPLTFREWHPRCRMERGVWNIPIPADGEQVVPDVTIAPPIGFDPECYRLGYGGGFYDRTLASISPRPTAIGIAHPVAAIKTIFPQPYDIPMDVIVTGKDQVQINPNASDQALARLAPETRRPA